MQVFPSACSASHTSSCTRPHPQDENGEAKTAKRLAFQWRAGDDRTTTGIWLWSEPFFRKIGKEEVAILLMDTQVRPVVM